MLSGQFLPRLLACRCANRPNLAAARLRHIAGTAWSTKRYLNIELLKDQQMRGAIPARASAGSQPNIGSRPFPKASPSIVWSKSPSCAGGSNATIRNDPGALFPLRSFGHKVLFGRRTYGTPIDCIVILVEPCNRLPDLSSYRRVISLVEGAGSSDDLTPGSQRRQFPGFPGDSGHLRRCQRGQFWLVGASPSAARTSSRCRKESGEKRGHETSHRRMKPKELSSPARGQCQCPSETSLPLPYPERPKWLCPQHD